MHKTIEQAIQFLESLAPKIGSSQVRVFLAAPYTAIHALKKRVQELSLPIEIGGQNMNDADEGAFTGEIAASMLKEAGASFVLLGHSERRLLFKETDTSINKKVLSALKQMLTPVLCVGETLEERESEQTLQVVRRQIEKGLSGIERTAAVNIVIAYEPVWAIGTGRVATAEEAQEVHHFCRSVMEELFGKRVANRTIIQYGGSVKSENAQSLIEQEDINGFLVGGASLNVDSFYQIIKQCEESI
jgi:triosephosphate isomerase